MRRQQIAPSSNIQYPTAIRECTFTVVAIPVLQQNIIAVTKCPDQFKFQLLLAMKSNKEAYTCAVNHLQQLIQER